MSASLNANEVFITHLVNGQSITVTTGADSEARIERSLREKEVHHQRIGAASSSTIGNNLPDMDVTIRCVRGTATVSDPVAASAGGGDVTAAGDNTFTGDNVFDGTPQQLGSNLITNGDFATDATGWELHDCGTWGSGKVTVVYADGDYAGISQSISVEAGKTYLVEFTISGLSGDVVAFYVGDYAQYQDNYVNGVCKAIFTAAETGSLVVAIELSQWRSAATFAVDTVSVKEIVTPGSTLSVTDAAGNPITPVYGLSSIGIGNGALGGHDLVESSTAIGYFALAHASGYQNTAVGADALRSLTTGNENVAIGAFAAADQTSGTCVVAVGAGALQSSVSVVNSVAVGRGALRSDTSGYDNTAVGHDALRECDGGANNVAVGYYAAQKITTGGSNTFLGDATGTNVLQKVDVTNSTAIGQGAYTTKNNQVVIGNGVTETVVRGLRNMVAASETPDVNGQMVFELTSDTSLKVKVKGSDGTVRSVTLTLS